MINASKAHEIRSDGLLVEGAAGFFSGSGVPTFTAPAGSIYTRTDLAEIWIRLASNVWQRCGTGHLQFEMNGSVAANQYILVNSLVSDSHFLAIYNTEIIGLSWTNNATGRNFDIEFYYGTSLANVTLLYTYQARNKQSGSVKDISFIVPENNFLYMKVVSQGQLPSDLALTLDTRG